MGAFDDLIPQSEGSGAFDDLIPKQEPGYTARKSRASAADYIRAIDSGVAQGVANIGAGVGTVIQDPGGAVVSGLTGARAAADRGLTWLINQSGGEAENNADTQRSAQIASEVAADRRSANVAEPWNLPAQAGRYMEKDSRKVVDDIQAKDRANNPELTAQQQEIGKAEGFVDNLRAAWDNPLALTHTLARSAPDMALGVGIGSAMHRAGAGVNAVSSAGIASEAASSAMQAREGTYQQVVGMPVESLDKSPRFKEILASVGDPILAREMLANELADQTPVLSGLGTAAGTVLANRLFGGDATAKSIVGEKMGAREFGKRVLQDTLEEGLQGVPEDTVQHGAMVQADPTKKYDPAGSLAQNLVAGLAMGSGGHTLSAIRERMPAPAAQFTPPPGQQPGTAPAVPPSAGPTAAPAAPADQGGSVATANTDAAEQALRTPVSLTALDRVNEIDTELARVQERRQELTPANGYGPTFDSERGELFAKGLELEEERKAIASTWPKAQEGAPTAFSTEAGVKLEGKYALMDAADLVTSHDEGLRANPLYPAELQPRDRGRQASELQVSSIVQKLDPARLGLSADAATGAPIVGADGLVESGNARTIALKRVYQAQGQKAEDYKQFLRDNAVQFGLSTDQVDAMDKPVLVRVRATPVNRAEFARQANQATIARMSPSEQAMADAKRLTSLEGLQPDDEGNFQNSRDFIRQFMATLPITEQSDLIEADGKLSTTGYRRIQNAVLARAYGDSPSLRRMTESMDNNLVNVTKALVRVAPTIAAARERMEAGTLHQADIAPDLLQAVEGLSALKEKGWTAAQELAQVDLTGPKYSPEATQLLTFLSDNARSPRKIAEFLQRYYEALEQAGDPSQPSMFGDDGPAPARGQLLNQAKQGAEDGNTDQNTQRGNNREGAQSAAQDGRKPQDAPGGSRGNQGNGATGSTAGDTRISRKSEGQSEWVKFRPDSGTLGIPRSEMPQIKGEHRGALINFLNARGIEHAADEVDPASLKPTQAEFSTAKVERFMEQGMGANRSVLISYDGHVLDGHHQWLAYQAMGTDVPVIRLDAPIKTLLGVVAEFPSVRQSEGAGQTDERATAGRSDGGDGSAAKAKRPTAKKTPKNTDPSAAIKPWRDKFESAKTANDKDAIQSLHDKVRVYLNGPAQARGEAVVAQFETLKSDIEQFAEDTKTVAANAEQSSAEVKKDDKTTTTEAEPLLTAPTEADIVARQDAADAAKRKQEAADSAAKQQADQDEDRKRIAQASVRAADTFELGQNALDSLTGQQDIFGAPAEPSADEKAKEKAKADLKDALGDLADIFGKNTRINIVPEQEQKLLPVLSRVMDAAFRLGYLKFKDAAKFALDKISQALGTDVANQITLDHMQGAYIAMAGKYQGQGADTKKAVVNIENRADIENHTAQAVDAKENQDVPGANERVEPDSQKPATEPAVGDTVQAGGLGPAAADAGQAGGSASRKGRGRQPRGDGVPAGSTTAGGERSDFSLPGGNATADAANVATGADFSERGSDIGVDGVSVDPVPAAQVDAVAQTGNDLLTKEQRQRAAEKVAIKPGDLDNIKATLPYLLEGQQEDVKKTEDRFAQPDGYGMLFTNGTGTGKTFTGLGVIKRLQRQGKTNTLIVVPDDKIAADWVESGVPLGLNISKLKDTRSAGAGIVVATYANLGENDSLASRAWDLVVADEAHSLMQSADGKVTTYLANLRAITHHPDGAYRRHRMLYAKEHARMAEVSEQIDANNKIMSNADTMAEMVASVRRENEALEREQKALAAKLRDTLDEVKAEVKAMQGPGRARLLALSATPFAYEFTVDWANGYLFDYAEGQTDESKEFRGYNQGSNRERFFMTHFGYSMRYNKLTKPDASKVDTGLLQRNFNGWLRKKGSLSARMLDVPADYDRRFVLVDSAIGNTIDDALNWISENAREGDNKTGFSLLREVIDQKFDYLSRRYLLEAIKANESVPIVRQHLAMGRKVVVFHDYKKGGGFNPFNIEIPSLATGEFQSERLDDFQKYKAALIDFRAKFKGLVDAPLGQLASPIAVFKREFPDVLLVNGDEKKSDLLARYKRFQDDASGPQVMLVQSAKNKGWSGHDTTGKHQRVLINLGQPTAPTLAIQQEGRIYRTGQVTDAIQRYLNTGTNWEKWAFATTIAGRASTAENLGMGEQARALKDSFIAAFEESDAYPPGHEGEGKGGKARDQLANAAISAYDRAKTYYWATQKKNSKTKAQEGADYFATPEPLGFKMAEWLGLRGGESSLEPSGGHGAIARWLPEVTNRTVIEPSNVLRARLAMAMDVGKDRIIDGRFEDHAVVNKYDGIAMNPPFGVGGKLAIEHLAKAVTHLRDGGRIVALIPTGPAADKRFEQWMYGTEERAVKPLAQVDYGMGPQDIYRGDTIKSRASWAPQGVVTRKTAEGEFWVKVDGKPGETMVSAQSITSHARTGPRTQTVRPADGIYTVADIKLPQVTFERAGTAVATRVVVLEKQTDKDRFKTSPRNTDLSNITDIKELFDRLEDMAMPERSMTALQESAARTEKADSDARAADEAKAEKPKADKPKAANPDAVGTVDRAGAEIVEHVTQKGKTLRGIVRQDLLKEEAQKIDPYTFRKDGGWFIRDVYLKKADGDTQLSRGTATGGVAPKALESLVDGIRTKNPNLPKVNVLADPSQAPRGLREYIERQGAMADVEGAMHDGELYLFASGLSDLARAEHVLIQHEAAHYGLRAILGDKLKTAMNLVYANNGNVRKAATELQKRGKLTNAEAAEEVIVDIPTSELAKLTGWRKVVAMASDWLGARGYDRMAQKLADWLDGSLTDQQRADLFVAELVKGARDYVAGKRPGTGNVKDTRLASSLAADIDKQEKWLQAEARERGYKDIEDLLEKNYPLFEKLAVLWRQKNPADEGVMLSRGATPKTLADRVDDILTAKVGKLRPLDAAARMLTQATGIERLTGAIYDRAAALLNRVPEGIKAGLVADYGVPQAVIDQRTQLQGRQRVQLRKAGELVDKLATLTRAESRVAYEWMNMDGADPAAYMSMLQGLPEESVKVLTEVQQMIDKLSKEAVRMGQLSQEAYDRNKFAYLRRSYAKHILEQTEGEKAKRSRTIAILGEQYKGRGLTETAAMDKIKAVAPGWWGRKMTAGKADTALKGERFVRLEYRTHKQSGVMVRMFPNGKTKAYYTTRNVMADTKTKGLPDVEVAARDTVLKDVVYWPAGEPIPAQYKEWDKAGTWEVRDVKGPNAVLWRDFTKDEREVMGEVDEARFAIAKTLHAMIHDVEVGRYLEWMAVNQAKKEGESIPGTVVEASERMRDTFAPSEWVRVPDSKIAGTSVFKYGKLAGRYLPGPVWNDLRQVVNGQFKPFGEVYAQILSAWKTSKTALSPAVHMNNVMSNFVMADWHDVGASHVAKSLRILLAASSKDTLANAGIADREAAREILARYTDSGGDIGSWVTTEISSDQLEPLMAALEKELAVSAGVSVEGQTGTFAALQHALHLRFPSAWEAFKPTMVGKGVAAGANGLIGLYQSEDDVFRLAAWLKAKEEGATDIDAGRNARKSFLDYHINAPWVQAMRQSAWPFISFTYRAVPMLAEIAGKKPHKLMKLMMIAGGLNALGVMLAGGGDDEKERKLLPEEKAGSIWGMVPKLIRMPWNDAHGSPVYLDIRRFVPVGDVFDIGAGHSAVPILPGMMPGGPLVLMGEVFLNKSAFTGKAISLETDTNAQQAAKVVDHLYKAFAPNIIGLPGTYATEGVVGSLTGRTDAFGREMSTAQAVASSFGVKLASYPADVMRRNLQAKAAAESMEIQKNITQLKRQLQTGRIDRDEFESKVQVELEKKRKVMTELGEKMR